MIKTIAQIKHNLLLILIASLFFFSLTFFSIQSVAQNPTPVETDFVVTQPLNQSVPVIGRVVSLREAKVPAAVQGKIEKIFVEVGDKVKKNDVLAVIDIEYYKWLEKKALAGVEAARATLDNAKAVTKLSELKLYRLKEQLENPAYEVEAARATLENAEAITNLSRLELNRLESLRSSPAFNASKYEDILNKMSALKANESLAKAKLNIALQNEELSSYKVKYEDLKTEITALIANEEIAKANLNSALQDYKVAKQNLERSEVKASFGGVIEKREIEVGEAVGLGFTLFSLVSDTLLEIEADVPVNRTRLLKPEEELMAKTSDNISFSSNLRSIGVRQNSSTRTIQVRLSFQSEKINRTVYVGENITVSIPIGPGIISATVHKDAILKREGLSLVYVLKDGIAQIKPVELGDGIGDRFVIKKGLTEGEEVVIKGNERLRPGQKISSLNNPATGNDQ